MSPAREKIGDKAEKRCAAIRKKTVSVSRQKESAKSSIKSTPPTITPEAISCCAPTAATPDIYERKNTVATVALSRGATTDKRQRSISLKVNSHDASSQIPARPKKRREGKCRIGRSPEISRTIIAKTSAQPFLANDINSADVSATAFLPRTGIRPAKKADTAE